MNTQTVKTFLPAFPGFYNSLIDGDYEIENYLQDENLEYDQIDFDFNKYKNHVAYYSCDFMEKELSDFGVISILFENVYSPKYYNFETDSVNCEITINPVKINEYIYSNYHEFVDYLHNRYKSCSGFISSYSHYAADWITATDNFLNFTDCNEHYLGAILNFICENEGIGSENLYSYIYENTYIGEFIQILEPINN
jgi:hypothetical protein